MAKDDDDDDSLPPLGENCDKFLDQAKKGQPRSFLLVCKGNKVKYLAVKKKPVKKAELAEAKKSGYKGDAYFGVITGKGMDLVFNLSMEDGYTSEPCKEKSLKDFLEEHAEFKCKPTFAIVATSPAIPFDEDDLSNPLIARFSKMDVQISEVLDARPDAEAELTKTVSEIRLLLQDGSFNDAESKINTLEARLAELLNGGPIGQIPTPPPPSSTAQTPTAPPPPPTSQPVDDALKAKLQAALDKLVPQLKQAVATYPDRKVELLTPVALIKKQMDSGDLQNAKAGILSMGQLLKSLTPAEPVRHVGLEQAEYEKKLADLQPLYLQAMQNQLGDTSKFRTVMVYANEQAEAGVYGNAIKAIDRLAQAIQQAISAGNQQPVASKDELRAEYERKLAALQPNYDLALQQMLGDTSKFRAAMAMLIEQAKIGAFPKAIEIIDRLSGAIAKAIESGVKETDVIEKGTVAERVAQLEKYFRDRFEVAKSDSSNEVAKIENGIQDVPNEDPSDLAKEIKDALNSMYDEAAEALVGLLKSSDKVAILGGVAKWRSQVNQDPLIQHILACKNEVGVDAKVLDDFERLFADIESEVQKTDLALA